MPISVVEDESFIIMLNKFDNPFKLKWRQTITNVYIPEKVKKVRENLEKLFEKVEYVSLTLDCWSSLSGHSYLGITSHFIDNKFELKNCLLAFNYVPFNHTSKN